MLVDADRLKSIVADCVTFARKFLKLPDKIKICLDKCGPNERFKSMSNPSETEFSLSDTIIYFNEKWVANRLKKNPYDLEYFAFHELRHMDQKLQIIMYDRHEMIKENPGTIEIWRYNFEHYIRNEGGESEDHNVRLSIELDVYIYANVLLNLYHMDAEALYPTIPCGITGEIIPGCQRYMSEKREIRVFLQNEGYVGNKQAVAS